MTSFEISLSTDFNFVNESNWIDIKRVNNPLNAFELKKDGMFFDDRIVSTGVGFIDQTEDLIRIGFMSTYDPAVAPTIKGKITVNSVVHRTFTSVSEETPLTMTNFRDCDTFAPGDMYRVPHANGTYEYFLITDTTECSIENGRVNNAIKESVSLGIW